MDATLYLGLCPTQDRYHHDVATLTVAVSSVCLVVTAGCTQQLCTCFTRSSSACHSLIHCPHPLSHCPHLAHSSTTNKNSLMLSTQSSCAYEQRTQTATDKTCLQTVCCSSVTIWKLGQGARCKSCGIMAGYACMHACMHVCPAEPLNVGMRQVVGVGSMVCTTT